MSSLRWSLGFATVLIGCGTDGTSPAGEQPPIGVTSDDGSAVDDGTTVGDDDTPPVNEGACGSAQSGAVVARVEVASGSVAGVLASNAAGDVAYTVGNGPKSFTPPYAFADGIVRLDASLQQVFTYPHGQVVALDAAGNAYVAGSFTAPVDLGGGQTVTPDGNVDVFLVKLDPTGAVLFAKALGLCGADLEAIALAGDGRIAVSGGALGTALLDANGDVQLQLGYGGKLAFDSAGDLVVAGSFAGALDLGDNRKLATTGATDFDGFVVKVDAAGHAAFALQLGDAVLPVEVGGSGTVSSPQTQAIAGLAIGANDEIAITGGFRYEMDLLGTTLKQPLTPPTGGTTGGAFVAKLAASGDVLVSHKLEATNGTRGFGGVLLAADSVARLPGSAIAVDGNGTVVVSSNAFGNSQPPFSYPQLVKLDAAGNLAVLSGPQVTAGFGGGVAVDGCGNILWSAFVNEPSLTDAHTFLSKIAP